MEAYKQFIKIEDTQQYFIQSILQNRQSPIEQEVRQFIIEQDPELYMEILKENITQQFDIKQLTPSQLINNLANKCLDRYYQFEIDQDELKTKTIEKLMELTQTIFPEDFKYNKIQVNVSTLAPQQLAILLHKQFLNQTTQMEVNYRNFSNFNNKIIKNITGPSNVTYDPEQFETIIHSDFKFEDIQTLTFEDLQFFDPNELLETIPTYQMLKIISNINFASKLNYNCLFLLDLNQEEKKQISEKLEEKLNDFIIYQDLQGFIQPNQQNLLSNQFKCVAGALCCAFNATQEYKIQLFKSTLEIIQQLQIPLQKQFQFINTNLKESISLLYSVLAAYFSVNDNKEMIFHFQQEKFTVYQQMDQKPIQLKNMYRKIQNLITTDEQLLIYCLQTLGEQAFINILINMKNKINFTQIITYRMFNEDQEFLLNCLTHLNNIHKTVKKSETIHCLITALKSFDFYKLFSQKIPQFQLINERIEELIVQIEKNYDYEQFYNESLQNQEIIYVEQYVDSLINLSQCAYFPDTVLVQILTNNLTNLYKIQNEQVQKRRNAMDITQYYLLQQVIKCILHKVCYENIDYSVKVKLIQILGQLQQQYAFFSSNIKQVLQGIKQQQNHLLSQFIFATICLMDESQQYYLQVRNNSQKYGQQKKYKLRLNIEALQRLIKSLLENKWLKCYRNIYQSLCQVVDYKYRNDSQELQEFKDLIVRLSYTHTNYSNQQQIQQILMKLSSENIIQITEDIYQISKGQITTLIEEQIETLLDQYQNYNLLNVLINLLQKDHNLLLQDASERILTDYLIPQLIKNILYQSQQQQDIINNICYYIIYIEQNYQQYLYQYIEIEKLTTFYSTFNNLSILKIWLNFLSIYFHERSKILKNQPTQLNLIITNELILLSFINKFQDQEILNNIRSITDNMNVKNCSIQNVTNYFIQCNFNHLSEQYFQSLLNLQKKTYYQERIQLQQILKQYKEYFLKNDKAMNAIIQLFQEEIEGKKLSKRAFTSSLLEQIRMLFNKYIWKYQRIMRNVNHLILLLKYLDKLSIQIDFYSLYQITVLSQTSPNKIEIKLNIIANQKQIQTHVYSQQFVNVLVDVVKKAINKQDQDLIIKFIFLGRELDYMQTFESQGVTDQSAINVVYKQKVQQAQPTPQIHEVLRLGYEKLLEQGIERQEIIRMRMISMAKTGYVTPQELQILYTNQQILVAPRGYTQPSKSTVMEIIRTEICKALNIPVTTQRIILNDAQIKQLYPDQKDPDKEEHIQENLSFLSFCLMYIEACAPERWNEDIVNMIDLSFTQNNFELPLPVVPVRYLLLEDMWNNNQGNQDTANIQDLAIQQNLQGPSQQIQQQNRVLSNFQQMLIFVLSIIVGVAFNVIILPFIGVQSIPVAIQGGIMVGIILNIIFGIFLTLTNSI